MKLVISLLLTICAWHLAKTLISWVKAYRPTGRDFLMQYLRRGVDRLLDRKIPWVMRYHQHILLLLNEVPIPKGIDPPAFFVLHVITGLCLGLLCTAAFPHTAWTLFPSCLLIGGVLPYVWLKHQQAEYHRALLKALPDYLDLQALVMEAGLDFSAGLQLYLEKGAAHPLQTRLRDVQREVRMGRSRSAAFLSLAQKTSFAPLRETCRSLVQAFSQGGSLSSLLREQASALRVKRMHIAERKAAEAPIKILFPLFVFIFPTIFIVLLGPMVLMFSQGRF